MLGLLDLTCRAQEHVRMHLTWLLQIPLRQPPSARALHGPTLALTGRVVAWRRHRKAVAAPANRPLTPTDRLRPQGALEA